ncbi:hypothetical protein KGO06_02950 [Patescibacteria group bacterium]|nr:hypothetical protein [Patescibacteria group bacterium]
MQLARLYTIAALVLTLVLAALMLGYMRIATERVSVPAWVSAATLASPESAPAQVPRAVTQQAPYAPPRYANAPGMERWYTNKARGYSFRLPEGFSAPEIKTETPQISGVWVHRPGSAEELAIVVYPVTVGTALDEQTVRTALKGSLITQMKESALGSAVRAITFYAKEVETGRETYRLWAAYNGYVYTMEVERPYEDLLRFVAANWYFAPPFPPPIKR